MTGDGGGRASAGPASYLFPCWTLLRGALHLQREGARSSPAQPQASPCPLPAPLSHCKDRTGQDVSGGAWVEGWGQGAFPRSLPPHRPGAVGTLTGLLSEAECGQAQEGEEHGGPHGAAAAAWTRPASAGPRPRLYSGLRPGGQECLPRLFGGHPPQLCRPNPKGCCGWSRSSLGRPLGVAGEEGGQPSDTAASGCPRALGGGRCRSPSAYSLSLGAPSPASVRAVSGQPGGVWGPKGAGGPQQVRAEWQTGGDSHCRPWAGAKPRRWGRPCPHSPCTRAAAGWAGAAQPRPGLCVRTEGAGGPARN